MIHFYENILASDEQQIRVPELPQTFRTLYLEVIGQTSYGGPAGEIVVTLNDDAAEHYSHARLFSNGVTVAPSSTPNVAFGRGGILAGSSGLVGRVMVAFPDYSRATWPKLFEGRSTVIAGHGAGEQYQSSDSGVWHSTSPIATIAISGLGAGVVLKAGSIVRLLGD